MGHAGCVSTLVSLTSSLRTFLHRVGNNMGHYREDVSEFYPFSRLEHYHRDCELDDYNDQHKV